MVKAENLFTFAELISIVQYILKQMIIKYLYRIAGVFLWILVLTSCLGSNSTEYEQSKDAQIYSFSITSRTDTSNFFDETRFSIDQIKGEIFNRDSLPYLFDVDSVMLNIQPSNSARFSSIVIKLEEGDSTYTWNSKDSVALHRLRSVETTAEDGKTTIAYKIAVNVHQQDPYIINWDDVVKNYLDGAVENQKTVLFQDKFITYYKTAGEVRASVASVSDAKSWQPIVVAGLPANLNLASVLPVVNSETPILYVADNAKNVYVSADGASWEKIDSDYKVAAVYGELPFITGEFAILTAVEVEGALKFATTNDFVSYDILNNLPSGLPIDNFSSVSLNNPTVYSAKYIILYSDNKIWIVQKNEDVITTIAEDISIDIDDAQLFLYDDKVYMLASEGDKNKLYFSRNYGLDWTWGGENQIVSEDMAFRSGSSVIADEDNFIWIFGGKSFSQTQIVDVWRGRLNKLAKN